MINLGDVGKWPRYSAKMIYLKHLGHLLLDLELEIVLSNFIKSAFQFHLLLIQFTPFNHTTEKSVGDSLLSNVVMIHYY